MNLTDVGIIVYNQCGSPYLKKLQDNYKKAQFMHKTTPMTVWSCVMMFAVMISNRAGAQTLEGLTMSNYNRISENRTVQLNAAARFDVGTLNVTPFVDWSVTPTTYASIDGGLLTTRDVPDDTTVTITARYSLCGQTASDERAVTIVNEPGEGCFTWLPVFERRGALIGNVRSLIDFDDGSGRALYVGFNNGIISRWNGSDWSDLLDGAPQSGSAMAVFDDGRGPSLYAAGGSVSRWDGVAWVRVGDEFGGGCCGATVRSLVTFDDGSGESLYAGGSFTMVGNTPISHVAKWNGTAWQAIGAGTDGMVNAMAVMDDGSRPALFVAGTFVYAGNSPASRVAKWNGAAWSSVGTGTDDVVYTLAVLDNGTDSRLCAGGGFRVAGGQPANGVAMWNGSSWTAMGSGPNGGVSVLKTLDLGNGPEVYAGPNFPGIVVWRGSSWSAVENLPTSVSVTALGSFDYGTGTRLMIGGQSSLQEWDGVTLRTIEPTGGSVNSHVTCLAQFDDGTGPALYAGGLFTTAGSADANRVAQRANGDWRNLGHGTNGPVFSMVAHNDDGQSTLFVGGAFTSAGSVSANGIACWNGTTWLPLGSGVGNPSYGTASVAAMAVLDSSSGADLYVGGNFMSAGGQPARFVARWDGVQWSDVGGGTSDFVDVLAVYDNGVSPELYAGGAFYTAGGNQVGRIARWNGTIWRDLAGGVAGGFSPRVVSLCAFNDGAGTALFVGGDFHTAGNIGANNIARWDGTTWAAVGGGLQSAVRGLAVFDDGTGEKLFAAGDFGIARWSGVNWAVIGPTPGSACLLAFGTGNEAALYTGGAFSDPASFIAAWAGPFPTIVRDPQSQSVAFGTTASFDVGAQSPTLRQYQWRKDGIGLVDNGRILGATDRLLSIRFIEESDEGNYDVVVSNDCGQLTSAPAMLLICPPMPDGDMNHDRTTDGEDISRLIASVFAGSMANGDTCHGDFSGDGVIDPGDIPGFVLATLSAP